MTPVNNWAKVDNRKQTQRRPAAKKATVTRIPTNAINVGELLPWDPRYFEVPPDNAAPPRLMSAPHPRAVGSLGPDVEDFSKELRGFDFRWWQRLVLHRALEVDEDGNLCWDKVCISTPRQSGKSLLLRELALWRMLNADRFGEPQEVLHTSMNIKSARGIMIPTWNWAGENGLKVSKTFASETIKNEDDGSKWQLYSLNSVYGASATLGMVDEAWAVRMEQVSEGMWPTLVERQQPQLWLLSTAHRMATELFRKHRIMAADPSNDVCLIEWSAHPAAQPNAPDTWRATSPHWSPRREKMIDQAQGDPGFNEQWLNRWPGGDTAAGADLLGWPEGWTGMGKVGTVLPPPGAWAVVEVSDDGKRFGLACGAMVDSQLHVWTHEAESLEVANSILTNWAPAQVAVGRSIVGHFTQEWQAIPLGPAETRAGTATLTGLAKTERLRHDHRPETARQIRGAVVTVTESGGMVSQAKSSGPIPIVKAVAWLSALATTAPTEQAAIW
jgi:hypothetical protein